MGFFICEQFCENPVTAGPACICSNPASVLQTYPKGSECMDGDGHPDTAKLNIRLSVAVPAQSIQT